jgi:hypothetical protein
MMVMMMKYLFMFFVVAAILFLFQGWVVPKFLARCQNDLK